MMKKIQRLGGAMFTPTLLFAFSGIMVGLSIIFTNPNLMGSWANSDHVWYRFWQVISAGAWMIFLQLSVLFALALPISLAKKQQGRACLEAMATYLTFNYFVNAMLTQWGSFFGVDISAKAGTGSGLTMIAGIKTLDTGMVGALFISGIVVWLHNRYFDKELPETLSIFRGSTYVVALAFFAMIPIAFLTCVGWPLIQDGIRSMQGFFINSGSLGIWVYGFLQKILIPTGLHHFIYAPFTYDNAIVQGGTSAYWATHLHEFATSSSSLKELFPIGFSLSGMAKVFGSVGVAGAFYVTARPEKKKQVLALMIPATLTAVLTGITEPLEFTFLFISPFLFAVHALLDATLQALAFTFGIVGDFGGGIINWVFLNWLPLGYYHWPTYLTQVILGLVFMVIWFLVFVFLIRRFDMKTPGREDDDEETKLYSKDDYLTKKDSTVDTNKSATMVQAEKYLALMGGAANIADVTNCATRLRVTVKDEAKLGSEAAFKAAGAHGLVHSGKAVQVIVGLDVPYVRDDFESLLIVK